MDQVIGTVVCFAGSYIPRYFAPCDGQILSIAQNQTLFSLLGNKYGGDGITTFRLPDLRGRSAVSTGQSFFHNYTLGETAGSESVTISLNHIPTHTHDGDIALHLPANSDPGIDTTVNGGYPAEHTGAYSTSGGSTMLAPEYKNVSIGNAGSGVPVDTRAPFLVITHIICLEGIYPSRS
ncbi:phage tail protein [Niastella caeni]|uniref:Phage tail protein n=1 Tax=Niastella caeni TaxID=2569763 RepID=A0A4S8HSA6_9BACT|nr:tail fiber protein [Niastella caeni]THU38340.1 phage tail protein [Niastella caeni]